MSKKRISDLIYDQLNYMYCDNCRFNPEIGEEELKRLYEAQGCEYCHRKYSGWEISRAECDSIADTILKTCQ